MENQGWSDTATATEPDITVRNRQRQAVLYGEPLGTLLGRIGEQLGLTQARIAGVLGLSAPMLSQLMSAQRIKIGNPVAVQRLQALAVLAADVSTGRVPLVEVEARLAEISAQAAVITQTTTGTASRPSAAGAVRAIQGLLRAVAGADELLAAAKLLDRDYPEIAQFLRVYGAGRTPDAITHYEANQHFL